MDTANPPAVATALAHIAAWGHHDWDRTRALVTMARSCLYLVDERGRIEDERDCFFILSS
ncbi:MAG TPA: hypothetical protein VKZ18_06305 [Polyangia bacterium]|nr:hypothetical protein [Polyangia bacterium]